VAFGSFGWLLAFTKAKAGSKAQQGTLRVATGCRGTDTMAETELHAGGGWAGLL